MEKIEKITEMIGKINQHFDPKNLKKLNLSLTERVASRLHEYSDSCETCANMLTELESDLQSYITAFENEESVNILEHRNVRKRFVSHLSNKHKLLQEDHFTSTYLALGLSLGLVFGMVVFDNIALGLVFGLAIGVAIGSGKDADAKKNGKAI